MSARRGAQGRRALSLPWLVALRYLKSTRRDAFISFLSAAAATGLALGTAVLILALGALSGFQEALKAEVLARTPEIEVRPGPGAGAAELRRQVTAIPGVIATRVEADGQAWLASGGRVRAVELVGYEGDLPPSFEATAGRSPGLYLPRRLAVAWGLATGDPVEIVSGRPTLSPLGPQPRSRRLAVAGTFEPGRTEFGVRVALPLAEAAALLGPGAERVIVSAGGLDRALAVAARLRPALPPGSAVASWRDLNRGLFFALRLEKSLMFVSVFLIVVVAALALVSDLTLVIASKQRDVGMLGAMGARPGTLQRIFVALGGSLATLGVVAGVVAGWTAAWLLDRYELLRLPGDVYFLDHVPFLVRPADLAAVVGATLGLALACALWAARRASALTPVEALRR